MKKLMNRALSIVLAAAMCVGLLSLNAFAANVGDECPNSRTYGGNGSHHWYAGVCTYCQASQSGSSDPGNPDDIQQTGDFCPQCYQPILVVEPKDDTYCWQKYCPGCGYDEKPTHDFGPDGDSEACMNGCGYKNPDWVPLPDGVYQAECGGTYKYDEDTGLAIVISKGTTCVDENVHDHECDFCHAKMVVKKWVDKEATCEHGGEKHEECVYAGCTIPEQYDVKKTTDRLDPVFPDTWTMYNNLQHYHNCVNCDGKAEDHVDYEPHDMTGWDEWKQINKDDCPDDKLPAGFNADTHTLWARGKHCQKCEYTEYQYEAREKEPEEHTLTIYYRYVDNNGEVAGVAGQVAEPFVGTFKEGQDFSVASPAAPAGYAREAGMDTVTGTMGTSDEVRTVKYEIITYTQTIIYRYANGREISRVEREFNVENRTALGSVVTEERSGYTFDVASVGIPAGLADETVYVTYTAGTTPTPDPEPEPDPEPTPEPPVDINEPEVPLVEEPDVDIEEPEVPLAKEPEVEIEEPDVPLAEVPETGDKSLLWGCLTLISGAGLALLALMDKKRKDDEA